MTNQLGNIGTIEFQIIEATLKLIENLYVTAHIRYFYFKRCGKSHGRIQSFSKQNFFFRNSILVWSRDGENIRAN